MLKSIINIARGNENKSNNNDYNDKILNYFISSSKSMGILSSFFKDIYSNIIQFKESLCGKITLLKNTFKNYSKIDDCIQYFYDSTLIHLYKMSENLEKYNEFILEPLNDFKTEYDNKSLLFINNLSSLRKTFDKEKNKVLFYHKKYLADIREYDKVDINNEELLNKIKVDLDIDKKSYKYQLDYFNDFYQNEFLNEYNKNIDGLKKIEASNNYFLKNIFYLFTNNIKGFKQSIDSYISTINSIFKHNKTEQNDIFKDNATDLSNFENSYKNAYKDYNIINKTNIDKIKNFYLIGNKKILDSHLINNKINIDNKNEYQNKILKEYFEYLDSNGKIPIKIICEINSLIYTPYSDEFYLLFIEEFLKRYTNKSSYIEIKNSHNISHLCHFFQLKISSILNDSRIFLLLLIGQKMFYYEDQKIFLCNLLNKISIFKSKYFWNNTFDVIVKYILTKDNNSKYNTIIDESIKKIIKDLSYDEINILNESSVNNKKYKYKQTNQLISNIDAFNSTIITYNQSYNSSINECFVKIHKIILLFISFLINYNYGINNSIELLFQICAKFSFNQNLSAYYVTFLKNYSYSIKNINNIDYYSKNNVANENESLLVSLDETKLIISKVIKYIDGKDLIKFLLLNKKYHKEIKDSIYKTILKQLNNNIIPNQPINIKIYITIWKNLLNYNEIKEMYPYEENKSKALKIIYDRKHNSDYSVIDVDCIRTYFLNDDNLEEKRNSLNCILKTIMLLNKECSYCQGMNYLVGFILSLCNDEEEAFYLSLCFFKNTSYKNIFLNELKLLRLNFAIFDKLLYIYAPALYKILIPNKIYSIFYISPWIITLFTYLINDQLKIGPFIKIFNSFIIHGWKSFFNISLNLFNNYEECILNQEENLIQFVSSDLSVRFINDLNNNEYNNMDEIKLSKKLLQEIKKEFNQFLVLVEEYD